MSDIDDDIDKLYALSLIGDGRKAATEIYVNSVVHVLIDEFPHLRDKIVEKFNDVVELHLAMRIDAHEYEIGGFNKKVKEINDGFKLMKGGGFFDE